MDCYRGHSKGDKGLLPETCGTDPEVTSYLLAHNTNFPPSVHSHSHPIPSRLFRQTQSFISEVMVRGRDIKRADVQIDVMSTCVPGVPSTPACRVTNGVRSNSQTQGTCKTRGRWISFSVVHHIYKPRPSAVRLAPASAVFSIPDFFSCPLFF